MHFIEVEGQQPFVRNGFKRAIVDFKIDRLGCDEDLFRRCREVNFRPRFRLAIRSVGDEGAFDEGVVQGAGQPGFVAFRGKAVERIGEVGAILAPLSAGNNVWNPSVAAFPGCR